MTVQGIQFHDLRTYLAGYIVIAVLALALIALAPTIKAHPSLARLVVAAVFKRVTQLRAYPESGRMVPELARSGIWQLP